MSLLSTGTSALIAFQRALSTTGHNIANAKTDGYSRQRVSFATQASSRYSFGQIGNGTTIASIRRVADQLATSNLLESSGELARLKQLSALSGRIDSLFSDKATNVAGLWSNFFDAANALAANAASTPERQQFLDTANALAARFRELDGQLDKLNEEVSQKLTASVDEINRLSREIAGLNQKIGADPNNAASDLLDQRDQLAAQLVHFTGGTATVQDNGQLNVTTTGGHALVIGSTAATVAVVADPYRADRPHLAIRTPGQNVVMADASLGGEIGGLFEFRSTTLDSARADLGRLAVGLAESMNSAHAQGMDLHGELGGDLFKYTGPRIAANGNNNGSAVLNANYHSLAALDGHDVQLRFDGTAWSAWRADTGTSIPVTGTGTENDPLLVNGVAISVSGSAQPGDSFLLQPTATAAGSFSVAISDPAMIAAANPVKAGAGVSNIGKATVVDIHVTDIHNPNLLTPATIEFTAAGKCTINGEGPFLYIPGQPIIANGWSITLDGAPAVGDTFTVNPTGANSSDNRNAKQLAAAEHVKLLGGGTLSLNGAVAGLTASVGSAARSAEHAATAQTLIHDHALAARDSVSGVNLDEEYADVLRLQQAYQAASQLVATADTLFQTLLNSIRR